MAEGFSRRFHWSGYLLGFALGGFFDGILLHQILQWHHLLSAVEGEGFRDIRVQVFADGLFHALMYLIAAVGLWLLWRARREFAAHGADRLLFADVLIGFGVWHVLDTLFSHWITGIHRVRMDSDHPLVWDLVWLVVFGIVPLVIGIVMRGKTGTGVPAGGRVAAILLAATVVGVGGMSTLPPPGVSQAMMYIVLGGLPEVGTGSTALGPAGISEAHSRLVTSPASASPSWPAP